MKNPSPQIRILIINLLLTVKGSENTFRDVALVQSEDKMKTKGSNENPNLRPYFAWNQQSFTDSTFFEYVAALINLVTCLRHQKTKPRI